eukprot:94344-Amphidinium_carterae.1
MEAAGTTAFLLVAGSVLEVHPEVHVREAIPSSCRLSRTAWFLDSEMPQDRHFALRSVFEIAPISLFKLSGYKRAAREFLPKGSGLPYVAGSASQKLSVEGYKTNKAQDALIKKAS